MSTQFFQVELADRNISQSCLAALALTSSSIYRFLVSAVGYRPSVGLGATLNQGQLRFSRLANALPDWDFIGSNYAEIRRLRPPCSKTRRRARLKRLSSLSWPSVRSRCCRALPDRETEEGGERPFLLWDLGAQEDIRNQRQSRNKLPRCLGKTYDRASSEPAAHYSRTGQVALPSKYVARPV